MGYKLAGFDVIGNCEIDPRMMKIYKANNHPKHSFLMDIRDFVKLENSGLPQELFDLDVLDGSPPCSVFSTAGKREDGWGTEKVFREGQAKQRLDDLFFWFIDVARKLQPKVVIAENVTGITKGNARGYVNEILSAFKTAGYEVQIFKLDASFMGVPQKRERVFFIAHRADLALPKLRMSFSERPILFGEVRSEHGILVNADTLTAKLLSMRRKSDTDLGSISKRVSGKESGSTRMIYHDDKVAATLISGGDYYRYCDAQKLSKQDCINVQTFPQDYDFLDQPVKYVCGMSVPPVMMAQVSKQVKLQWLDALNC